MFFLGGLNSVLPHLIYLSVIWAFLLIGFSGRIRFHNIEKSSDSKIYCEYQKNTVGSENSLDHTYDAHPVKFEKLIKNEEPVFCTVFYENSTPLITIDSPPEYRGPPAYCSYQASQAFSSNAI
jgi:hypothetical protein